MKLFSVQKFEEKGFALLLSIIISSVVLAIGVSLLHLSVSQINLASNARESEIAFQAAHAGMDCLWYWRNDITVGNAFLSAPVGINPDINCFGIASDDGSNEGHTEITPSDGSGPAARIDLYRYDFTWGDEDRCTQVDMYIMQPSTAGMTHNFSNVNEGIGNGAPKVCEESNLCTIIVSRGFNRACSDVENSVFTIQRELTIEF